MAILLYELHGRAPARIVSETSGARTLASVLITWSAVCIHADSGARPICDFKKYLLIIEWLQLFVFSVWFDIPLWSPNFYQHSVEVARQLVWPTMMVLWPVRYPIAAPADVTGFQPEGK